MPISNTESLPNLASLASLGLGPELTQATMREGFVVPTAIQQAAMGPVLQGLDVCATAPTGSGKTAAFCLPVLQLLLNLKANSLHKTLQSTHHSRRKEQVFTKVLMLAPTREIVVQIGDTLRSLATALPLKIAVVFGGVSINPQMMGLRGGADIIVATPGRLLDLLRHRAVNLADVQHLVLDEADRLLDLGFAQELADIAGQLPLQRQTLLFSATFPDDVQALAARWLRTPTRIAIGHATSPVATDLTDAVASNTPQIRHRVIVVDTPRRTQLLRHLVVQGQYARVLVFVATKHAAEMVADKLRKAGIAAEPFHGLLSQGKRSQVLMDFKASVQANAKALADRRVQVVVATDLAARGLDIAELPVVVNYDLPRSSVDFTHRIGRTARAGLAGTAISFVTTDNITHWHLIAKRQGLGFDFEQVPGFEPSPSFDVNSPPTAPDQTVLERPAGLGRNGDTNGDPNGGIKGKRPSKKDKLRAAARL